jgi:hypothetical protein
MKTVTVYTTHKIRDAVAVMARNEGKTLVEKCNELVLIGIPLVSKEDLLNTSRQTQMRVIFDLPEETQMYASIPFAAYRKRGLINEFLGLSLDRALQIVPKNAIVTLESKTLKCSSNAEVDLLKLLYPNCKIDDMKVSVSLASDEAFKRLKEIIATQPGIKLETDVTRGAFSITGVDGRTAKFKRDDYEFLVEIKEGSILILADGIIENDLIILGRDVLTFINEK